jgi:lipopolysaccharide biosynthesis regulator YciM
MGSVQSGEESTQRVAAPQDFGFVDEIVELLSNEVEALVTGARRGDPDALLADINFRLALLAWDLTDDRDGAARYLELAERHPLAPRLLLAQALASGSTDLLDQAHAAIERMGEAQATAGERALLMRDLAEAWLYRFQDPERAADCVRAADAFEPEAALAVDLHHLRCLALSMAEDWTGLVDALLDGPDGAEPPLVAEAVHVLVDRLDDRDRAAELISQCDRASSDVAFYLSGLTVEIGLADPAAPPSSIDVGEALSQRLVLLETDPAAARDAAATRFLLVQHLAAMGDTDGALAAVAPLTTSAAAEDETLGWGARVAVITRYLLLLQKASWTEAMDLMRELGDRPGAGRLSGGYRRRAAQLAETRAADPVRALELWRQVFAAAIDDESERAIERHLLGSDPAGLVLHLENLGRRDRRREASALRRASAVAETRCQDVAAALRLRRAALTADGDAVVRHDDMVRLVRVAGDRAQLAELYAEIARTQSDPALGSVYLCASGALELVRGRERVAEQLFQEAARAAPDDLSARIGLAVLLRRTDRAGDLAEVLTEMAELCVHEVSRFDILRELSDVYSGPLDDHARARATLEQALQLRPDDPEVVHDLARLYDGARDWTRSIELRHRAIGLSKDKMRIAELLLEVGGIEESQRRDDSAALAAFQRVLEIEPSSPAALESCARQHRKAGRKPELIGVLRQQTTAATKPELMLSVHLEIAGLAEELAEGPDAVLAAYGDALQVDPENQDALRGLERVAGKAGRWQEVVRAFRAAPETPGNLRALANALSEQQAWPDLAEVRLKQIATVPAKTEKAELSRSLAELYQNKLNSVDDAVRMYSRAIQLDPSDDSSQRSLVALLEQHGRWRELAQALERELASVPADEIERQVTLLLRLGEIRRVNMNKLSEAAQAFELVLERRPHHRGALDALEALYGSLSRTKDLMRVLELRAEIGDGGTDRAPLLGRIAALRERAGDVAGALDAYHKAFAHEPSNREIFNALEKLAYRNEQWQPVMELYALAIRLVESGQSRAYRLGDLYARRGEVQLRYLHELGEAAASYLRVVELEPDNDEALGHLEAIFAQQEDWTGLIGAYEKRAQASKDPTRQAAALRAAARIAGGRLGDPLEVVRLFQALLEADPRDQEALVALERHHEKAGDWDRLVEVLRSRIAVVPPGEEQIALLLRIAQICEEGLRDDDRAIEHYQRILNVAPGNKTALESLGRIYESTERWADFVDVTRRQIKVTSDRNVKALLYFKCGSVMEAKFGKQDDAIRYYDAAIKTSPACLPAVHGLRDLYRRREDWPRVIQTLELEVKLWQDDKERAGVFAQIGRIYAEQLGQPDRGLHYYESALAVDPDCVPANRALFDQYFDAEQWERALPLAQALAQKAMRDGDPTARSEFYRKRGVVIWKTGDSRSAAESIIIALEIKPNNLAALEALGQVARAHADSYDFPATYRELEKIYRKRDDATQLLAHVMVAQAVTLEREGDLDGAEKLYSEAAIRNPIDFAVVSARVDLYVAMRRWKPAVDTLLAYLNGDPRPGHDIQVKALLRVAEIHADGEMDPHKAIRVLTELIRFDESVVEAHYLLAQEYFSLKRFAEARGAIERVIELAAAPGLNVAPEQLARYYYYLGRIIEQGGEARAATSHYRRAAEYDPGYAPPALALAARAADAGDQAAAETLLIDAAHAAMQRSGEHAAVPLQRGLARILLAAGDRGAAIEAYRGILAVEPDNAADRIALAEIHAHEDLVRAIEEVKQVIQRDLRHGPAYRLLASFYARAGETERAVRVLTVMECLGYAEEPDRRAATKARAEQQLLPISHSMRDELRRRFLLTRHATSPLGEVLEQLVGSLTALFPEPPVGTNLIPLTAVDKPELKAAVADSVRLFNVDPEIYIGQGVARGMVALSHPRPIVVIDAELLAEADAAHRFLLGVSFDAIRGGYALLQSMGRRQRAELGGLLKSMLLPENERPGPTTEFMRALPRPALRVIERLQGMARQVDSEEWIDGMLATGRRAGLFACDDFAATTRMIALLGGDQVGATDIQAMALVLAGEDLVRFYLSDEYHRLRDSLSRVLPAAN